MLPLLIAGILTGVVASLLAAGWLPRVGLVLAVSVLAGLAATAIVQSWLDVVGGDWWRNAAVLGLTVLSMAALVAGLYALLGEKGAILGALTMIFIGNPFSGVGSAPELLPRAGRADRTAHAARRRREPAPEHRVLRRGGRRRTRGGSRGLDARRADRPGRRSSEPAVTHLAALVPRPSPVARTSAAARCARGVLREQARAIEAALAGRR